MLHRTSERKVTMDVAQFYSWLARKRDRWILAKEIAAQLKLLTTTQKTEHHYNLVGGRLTHYQWPSKVKIRVQPGAYYPFLVCVAGTSCADAERLATCLRRRSIGVAMISDTDDGATMHARLIATQSHNCF